MFPGGGLEVLTAHDERFDYDTVAACTVTLVYEAPVVVHRIRRHETGTLDSVGYLSFASRRPVL